MPEIGADRSRDRGHGTLVLLRHGHSEGNATGGITGWLDVALTARGREEAARAAVLLEGDGCRPTAVHTSRLRRAEDTARIVADRLVADGSGGAEPLLRRSWLLNERHYGALQGRARAELRDTYGADRVEQWRRSPTEYPPLLPASDPSAPGHDPKYADLPTDRLPLGESFDDVLARVRQYWPAVKGDLDAGHTVLVVAHSNSLRALCALLDRLDDAELGRLEVPTGVPLRYDDLGRERGPRVRGGTFLAPDLARVGLAEQHAQNHPRSTVEAGSG
jgi:2,3-bisphosphoglycerate-dependent phosphoglycerate mutase